MPNHWVLNASKFMSPSQVSNMSRDKSVIGLKTGIARLPLKEGDNYITLGHLLPADELVFAQYGEINKITTPVIMELTSAQKEENRKRGLEGRPPLYRQEYIYVVTLGEKGALKDTTKLDDYAYSLLSIYRYSNPGRHFRRQYTAIYEPDYETITKEQVYIARTAFGRLINALPQESKYDFILHAINHFGTVEFNGIDFIKAYEYLQEYIEENILSQGRYLVSSYEMLNGLSDTGVSVERVGFAEHNKENVQPGNNADHNISVQARYFQELFRAMEEQDFSGPALQKITRDDTEESRFEEIFKNRPWPVEMAV